MHKGSKAVCRVALWMFGIESGEFADLRFRARQQDAQLFSQKDAGCSAVPNLLTH